MKTLTTTVRAELVEAHVVSPSYRSTTPTSFRARSWNPAFKLISRLFAVFGLMIMFTVSGWGADECNSVKDSHTFTESGVDATYTDSYSGDKFDDKDTEFYYFKVPSAGKLKFTRDADNKVDYKYHLSQCPDKDNGTTINNNNTITFTAATDFNMRIRSSNDDRHYNFTFVFTPDAPAVANAVDDSVNVSYNTALTGNVLTNDTGPSISVMTWNNPSHGVLSAKNDATGAFTYTPTANYTGADSFTYTIKDSGNHTSTATVNIIVSAPSNINFSIAGNSVDEGNSGTTSLPFVVTLSGLTCTNSNQTFTVDYATSDGTAGHTNTSPTNDYTSKTGTLTFYVRSANNNQCSVRDATNNGNTLKNSNNNTIYISSSNDTVYQTLKVDAKGDTTPELDETVKVTLSSPISGTGITTAEATGTILNDDVTDVTMTKSASPTSVATGGQVTYTLKALYSGSGNAPSGSIIITDPLPVGMGIVSATGNNWSCTGTTTKTCTYNTTISSGNSSSALTIVATAPTSVGTGSVDNIATVSTTSDIVESDTTNNTANAAVTILSAQADMVLSKTATSSVAPSGSITYTLRGTNNGSTSASGIQIVDTLPAGVAYVSKSGTNWGTCTVTGTVAAGQTVTCSYNTSVSAGGSTNNLTISATAPATTGTKTNNATISTTTTETSSTNNSASASTNITNATVSYTSDNPRDFDIIYTANMNGDIKMIGNSVLCKDSGDGATCTAPDNTTSNNSTDTLFYTLASDSADSAIFNSSSYELTLPSGVGGSNVLWAGLYWQGEYKGSSVPTAWMDEAKNVKLKAPGDSAYRDLTADTTNNRFNWMVGSSGGGSSSSYVYYQGVRDITSVVQGGGSGTYQVANVKTSYGANYSPGHFGGWAIAIVYKDFTATLKNMTVYDGYGAVNSNNPLSVTATGFLTPSSGAVESKFTIFATEGDISYTADSLTLSKSPASGGSDVSVYTPGTTSNPFSSSISDESGASILTRTPNYPNMIGVDIHTYNVGTTGVSPFNILGAGQTSTTIKLSTGNDVFNPGAFAFSTQLYIPDVCYLEDVYYNDALVSATNIPRQNDNVTYDVTITNKNNEVAKGVFIEKVFDKPREISYVSSSMSIDTVAKTDTMSDDTAEYSTDTNTSKFLLGVGAAAGMGGSVAKDFITKFKYDAKIGDQNASENIYLVSYRNDQLGVTFNGIPIRKCQDFNNSFGVYVPIIGKYNTVRTGAVNVAGGDTDPVDALDVKNALYTQIMNKPFTVDVLSLGADNITPTAPSSALDLNLTIVELTADGNCTDTNLSATQTLHFTTANKYKTTTVLPFKISKNAAFHMVTSNANLCSRDRFAIRPNAFKVFSQNQYKRAGEDFNITIKAIDEGNGTIAGVNKDSVFGITDYNASLSDLSLVSAPLNEKITNDTNSTPLAGVNGCLNAGVFAKAGANFADGSTTATLSFSETGILDINLSEIPGKEWALVDAVDTNPTARYITPSIQSYDESNVSAPVIYAFIPYTLQTTAAVNATTAQRWLYVNESYYNDGRPDVKPMGGILDYTITAKNKAGVITQNFDKECFAYVGTVADPCPTINGLKKNTTFDLFLDANITMDADRNRTMRFYTEDNASVAVWVLNQALNYTKDTPRRIQQWIGSKEFQNGVGQAKVYFNFDRNQTIAIKPLNVSISDINTSTSWMANPGATNDFKGMTPANNNLTFVYGRIIPRDVRIFGENTPFTANGWYEVFNAPSIIGTPLAASRNDAMWYINTLHNDTNSGDASVTYVNTTLQNPSVGGAANNGMEDYIFAGEVLGGYKAHINTDSWLWYGANALPYSDPAAANFNCLTHPCFNINVAPSVGATGSAKSTNTGTKNSKSSTGGGGAWSSTTDYAPAIR